MRVSVVLAFAAVVAIVLPAVPGCGDGESPADAPATTAPVASSTGSPAAELRVAVTGTCKDPEGMRLQSSGFTPNGTYTTEVWYPDGKPYTFIAPGVADAQGATPNWRWNCNVTNTGSPDPAGTYKLRMTDDTTGRSITTNFVVGY
jgi:hypothetical protein